MKMIRRLWLTAALLLAAFPAMGQIGPTPPPGSCTLTSGTLQCPDPIAAPGVAITGTGTSTFGSAITFDYSQGAVDTRYSFLNNTLALTQNTTNLWEQDNSFATLAPSYNGITIGAGGAIAVTVSGGAVNGCSVTAGNDYPNGTFPLYFSGPGSGASGSLTVSGNGFASCSASGGTGYTSTPSVAPQIVNAEGEINWKHAYGQVNYGAYLTQGETIEASFENFGLVVGFDNYLGIFRNASTGIVTGGITGVKFQLTNDNTAPGSVNQTAWVECAAPGGAGSLPTSDYCIYITDPNASITTAGGIRIAGAGSLVQAPAGTLTIEGPDTGTTCIFCAYNSNASLLLAVDDNGTFQAPKGGFTLGTGGNVADLVLGGAAGSLQLRPPVTGTLSGTVTVPNVTDTLLVANTSQTITQTQTFSGTLDVSGTLETPSSTTGSSTQTFVNSPCSTSLTAEQWIPVTINGQTGTWYVPACH